MPNFNEVTGKQFLDDYNGKQLFKEFAPVIGQDAQHSISSPSTREWRRTLLDTSSARANCTQEAADALVVKFNELYDK